MALRMIKGVIARIDHNSEEEYVQNEKSRSLPWSVTPFKQPEEEESEPPSEWLELAGDLVWTASFSSLTSNTEVTDGLGVSNYAVFFALTWHLWATQATYDIRFYTNDWVHRVFFALQLGIYAVLAAFSGSFTVGWELDHDTMYPFTAATTNLTQATIYQNAVTSMERSFKGVNFILCISRVLLCVQYCRVLYYRSQSGRPNTFRFCLPALSSLAAAGLFIGSYAVVESHGQNATKSTARTQLAIWGAALLIQVLSSGFTAEDDEKYLKLDTKKKMANRLTNLTVIILGEGLNGICQTLRHSINSLGLSGLMIGEIVAILFILYFIWIIYFDGFKLHTKVHKAWDELWLWSHFFLHLSLIMVLEGIKNLYLYVSVNKAIHLLNDAIDDVFNDYHSNNGTWPDHPKLERLLLPLKMSWQQEISDLNAAEANDPDNETEWYAVLYRWMGDALYNIYKLFNEEENPKAEDDYNTFKNGNASQVVEWWRATSGDPMTNMINEYDNVMSYTGRWLLSVAGSLLVCLALLNIIRRIPQNRYAWGYCLNRAIIGAIMIFVGLGALRIFNGDGDERDDWLNVVIPIVAICYLLSAIIDLRILGVSMKSINKHDETLPGPGSDRDHDEEKGGSSSARTPDVLEVSNLSYGNSELRKRELMATSSTSS